MNLTSRNIGVNFLGDGRADITVWAPTAKKVSIIPLEGTALDLSPAPYGYWKAVSDRLKPGDRYRFSVDGQEPLPDPASLSQPGGVHDPSEAIDIQRFEWSDKSWKNPALDSYIIYELHTGTFSSRSDFQGIIDNLPHLLDLGITAVEIMPVGQFPGRRNWGYDGVYPFAVQHSYGGPRGLQQLVNACHAAGIAVILDIIYNHLGPEGNYLSAYGPYFTDKYNTPWGKALNFDDAWSNGARDYFLENALMWFRDFHIDALRMDAVHAIKDFSASHILKEIRDRADELEQLTGRKHYLIAELDLNDPKFISDRGQGGFGLDAQWVDEFHHALRVAAGEPPEGYYADFNGIKDLAKSYRDVYVYDGQFSEHRKKFFGRPATGHDGTQFVVFSQNHDQTGNRMLGERTSTLVSFEMCKLLAGSVLSGPFLPMLFMGEEWNEPNPFLFFIDHTDSELAALVNAGRKKEFSYFNWKDDPPDPRLEATFSRSGLQWHLKEKDRHRTMFAYYKALIALRKNSPALRSTDRSATGVQLLEAMKTIVLDRSCGDERLICFLNFSGERQEPAVNYPDATRIFDSSESQWGGPTLAQSTGIVLAPESFSIYKARSIHE